MAILSDYHMHSHHSGDSSCPMEEQIESAITHGLSSICFTEHFDMDFPYEGNPELSTEEFGIFELNMEEYRKEYLQLNEQYHSKIKIFFGVELGLQPHLNERYLAFLSAHPELDFCIGSTHVAGKTDPYYPRFYEGRPEKEAYREYFTYALNNVRACDCFDSYGHLDYVVRYGPNKDSEYQYEDYRDLIDPLLSILIERGCALEVNTSALSKGCKDVNPCRAILTKYLELGGHMITVGSDAHYPDNVAKAFDRVCEELKDIGFTEYYTFEKRKAIPHSL